MTKRSRILCINTTQDLDLASDVEFMYDHLKALGRPCAIVKRLLSRKTKKKGVKVVVEEVKYSCWRVIDDEEQSHYRELTVLEKIGDYAVVKESGGFSAIMDS
ncbi:MAG: hypothetical protein V3R78_09955 [Thermodesulfobacteriota bacterium]